MRGSGVVDASKTLLMAALLKAPISAGAKEAHLVASTTKDALDTPSRVVAFQAAQVIKLDLCPQPINITRSRGEDH